MIKKILLGLIFILGLVYLLVPGPEKIEDFAPLPQSLKSQEPGDTYQNPNIAAYFSNLWRDDVTAFYYEDYKKLNKLPFFFPPLRLNHPPEESFQFIRDQQPTSYLEEYVYPLRSSIFVNGWEPYDKSGKRFNYLSHEINVDGIHFDTKTTIRFYPNSILWRVLVYILIWLSFWGVIDLYKKVLTEKI